MNSKNIFRAALAACALLGAMLPVSTTYAGTVTLNGGAAQCGNGGFNMAMTPAGDLTISCVNSGGAPVCSLSASSTSVIPGSTVSLTASCTNSPTSYSWTNAANGPTFANTGGSGIFNGLGSYTYSVTATNATGTSAAASVTINVVANPVPSCTLTANPGSIQVGQTSTLTASCNNGATAINWTNPAGAPSFSNTGGTGTFSAAGSYTYSVTGTNATGTGAATQATVTVAAAGNGSCQAVNIEGVYTSNGQWRAFGLQRGGVVAMQLPLTNSAGKYAELTTTQTTSTQPDLQVELSISTCPGDPNPPAGCKWFGGVWGGATAAYGSTSGWAGYCPIQPGTQYYVNIRDRKPDGTFSCVAGTCSMILQYNGNMHF